MWDTKYRPLKFSEVIGQEGSVAILKSRLKNKTALDTSYMFFGGAGQGKTTLARILARALLCSNIDLNDPEPCNECDNCFAILNEHTSAFLERDAATQGTVDDIREIVAQLPFKPFGAPKRIYLFDECHRMSKDAQDALLKPIEDKKMVGMLCTTEPEKVRDAIRSRCEEYAIRKVTREDISGRMLWVLEKENVRFDKDAVDIVIDYCGGHVRDILNKLEMISQMGDITKENVREYLNLSVISTYYNILLCLTTAPENAVELVDLVCQRVTPEEVASGLAEAAMNSFRLANKMFANFQYADKDLCQQVYQQYGNQTVKLAEFFLRSRYMSQVGLICDILTISQSAGYVPTVIETVSQPAIVLTTQQIAVASPTVPAPATTSPTIPPPTPAKTSEIKSAPPTPPQIKPSEANGMRTDNIGPKGVDPLALTDLDHLAVPKEMPRQANRVQPELSWSPGLKSADDSFTPIPAEQWKREFERSYFHRGAS